MRMLQRGLPPERIPERTQCRQRRMRAGLPIHVRPGGRHRQGAGAQQGPAVVEGLQPARPSAGTGCIRRHVFQDRGETEERFLCAEHHSLLFGCPGRPCGRRAGQIRPGLVRKGLRRSGAGSLEDFQPGLYRIVLRRKTGQMVFDGRPEVDGRVYRHGYFRAPARQGCRNRAETGLQGFGTA